MLSVSKQTQKVMTNSKDKEIIEETERYQEERPETQFKRKPSEDTNRNRRETETENEEKSCKKQNRYVRKAAKLKTDNAETDRQTQFKDVSEKKENISEENKNQDNTKEKAK